ncbi:MAG TPA: hypothetical protein VJV78_34290 [Polyangiales bacterium]|nr:hypothetical protein [Polyangiales bacterium]
MSLLLSAACAACAADVPMRMEPTGFAGAPAVDPGVIAPPPPICEADNPFCVPPPIMTGTAMPPVPTTPTPSDCGSVPIDLHPAGANIMVAVDGAAGMAKHWDDIQTALRSLRERHAQASFGLHLFWADAIDFFGGQTNTNMSNNGCSMVHDKVLDVGANSSQDLISFLGTKPPGGTITDAYQVAPIIDSLSYYLSHASKLADPKRTNYLLVVTTGNDNCFGSAFADKSDKLAAYQKLAIELGKLNIRTIPIGVDPPSATPATASPMGPVGTGTITGFPGFGGTTTLPPTDYEVLKILLEYGGSALKEVPRIDTPAKLTELVSEVGRTVSNCRFEIPAALDSSTAVNPFEISFSINGKEVPRDRHQDNGWDFVNDSTTQVEFFGQGCQALQAGQNVVANKSCRQDICGTAAINVMTKPRSVLVLLDSSLSRTECTDGSLDCLSLPGTAGRPLTFWETVQHSLGVALVAPVNDDVAFGLQFFPSKNAESLSCEVAKQPEIPPESGKQIAIMKSMLEKIPFGLSPVVGIIESVAAAPGKLADPGVVGAVVLLSDGGDNCSGDTQRQIVMRLGAAAKKLSDAGVKTFAIRYGSKEGETAEAAEQLTAIVTNGGTALTGGKTPYIDAKSQEELGQALAGISDKLASCAFPVDGIDPKVDKNRANLFLNGQQIGQDKAGLKQNGWNWTNPERTGIELYGEACTSFKTSRRTRVGVEFGCEPVIVQGPD